VKEEGEKDNAEAQRTQRLAEEEKKCKSERVEE
jgi:hypothetical protein